VGQLLLDCAMANLGAGNPTTCEPHTSHPLVAAINARRLPPNASGCRPGARGDGFTIDRTLTEAIAAGGLFPTGSDLIDLIERRQSIGHTLRLESTLTFDTATALTHALMSADLDIGVGFVHTDLVASSRPIVSQPSVGFTLAGAELRVDEHGFTLRYGALLRLALVAHVLEPYGLEEFVDTLGLAITQSVYDVTTRLDGCSAVSAIVCRDAGEANLNCLETSCSIGSVVMGGLLAMWHRRADGTAIDFRIVGAAPLEDVDADLVIDHIAQGGSGAWATSVSIASDAVLGVVGSFESLDGPP
jgi:hypothetical protein